MSKILKVTIEFDDHIRTVEGPEAEKWHQHSLSVSSLANVHGMNPFDTDPINWQITPKGA